MIKEIREIEFDTDTSTFSVNLKGLTLEDASVICKAIAARKYHFDADKAAFILRRISKAVEDAA